MLIPPRDWCCLVQASSLIHRLELLRNRSGTNDPRLCLTQTFFCIFCLPLISVNSMVKPSKMPPALTGEGLNKSLLSWDHLLKPNKLADVECEMYELLPVAAFGILCCARGTHPDVTANVHRGLLNMCQHVKIEHKNQNETQFVLVCVSLTATCAAYQPRINCYKCSDLLP